MSYKLNKFGVITLSKGTESFKRFSSELNHLESFLMISVIGDLFINEQRERARELLVEVFQDDSNEVSKAQVDLLHSAEGDSLLSFSSYEFYYGQMAFARTMDNVVTYFKEILAEVISKKPQVLKSKDTEKLEYILDFDSMDDLRNSLAEKKIEQLFYAGIDKIESFFKDRLGVELFNDSAIKGEFRYAVKLRNLIVHNRGIINDAFLREFPSKDFEVGNVVKFGIKDLSQANKEMMNFIAELELKMVEKFSLDATPFI